MLDQWVPADARGRLLVLSRRDSPTAYVLVLERGHARFPDRDARHVYYALDYRRNHHVRSIPAVSGKFPLIFVFMAS